MKTKVTSILLVIFAVTLLIPLNVADGKTIVPGKVAPWSCPANYQNPPTPDPNGNYLYYRIVDSNGNDFEIWCITGAASRYYQHVVSFPDGQKSVLSNCELWHGDNRIQISFDGTLTNSTLPSGAVLQNVTGNLTNIHHHNWDGFFSSLDFHVYYDFKTGEVKRVDTKLTGREYPWRKNIDTTEKKISLTDPPSEMFSFAPQIPDNTNPEDGFCAFGEPDDFILVQQNEIPIILDNGNEVVYDVFYPAITKIKNVDFKKENNSLIFTLGEGHSLPISLSIHRGLIDHNKDQFTILADKNKINFEENTSKSYRILNFEIPEFTKEIVISGSSSAKEIIVPLESGISLSPKKQMSKGIVADDVKCKERLVLVIKSTTGSAACVKPTTTQKLIERGWVKNGST